MVRQVCDPALYDQAVFCALIGRPHDPELTTLVEKGAWYSIGDVPYEMVNG